MKNISLNNIKNKGSIVPKRLVQAGEKKSQHLIKFGCKVEVINNKVTALEDGDIFVLNGEKYCNLKKNKRIVKGFNFKPCVESRKITKIPKQYNGNALSNNRVCSKKG